MCTVVLAIRFLNDDVKSVLVPCNEIDSLLDDLRFYKGDNIFIESFVEKFEEVNPFPKSKGIIVVDMVEKVIYDNQSYTGIFKFSPSEVIRSSEGMIASETQDNNVKKRFKEAVVDGRLKGFEHWKDSGTTLDEISIADVNDYLESSYYGQFIFDTRPYEVIQIDNSLKDQGDLFQFMKTHKFIINSETMRMWTEHIEDLIEEFEENSYGC